MSNFFLYCITKVYDLTKFLHFNLFLLIIISSINLANAVTSLRNSAKNPIDTKVNKDIEKLSIDVVRDTLLFQNFKTALTNAESYLSKNLYVNINTQLQIN